MSFSKLHPHNIASGWHMQLKPGPNYWMDFKSTLVFKKRIFFGGPSSLVPFPFSATKGCQSLSSVTRQSRQQRDHALTSSPQTQFRHNDKDKAPIIYQRCLGAFFFPLWTSESCQCLCPPPSFSPSSHQLACLDLSHMVYSQRGVIWSGSKELLLSPVSLHRMLMFRMHTATVTV